MYRISAAFSIAALAVSATSAHADLFVDSSANEILDITAAVGDGANTSYVIIDFAETGGNSYAFAFSWDEPLAPAAPLTSHDMLLAVALDSVLDATIMGSTFGSFVSNFAFGEDAGDPDNFWSFSIGEVIDPGILWVPSSAGIDDRLLADGSLDGWYNGFSDEFDAIPPSVPTTQIPAPMTGALLALACLTGSRRRRSSYDPSRSTRGTELSEISGATDRI